VSILPRFSSPDERRLAIGGALTLFGLLAGHTVLEVARDSLFLSRLSAQELPIAYLLIAATAGLAAQVDARVLRKLDDRRVLAITLGAGALGALAFISVFAHGGDWAPHAFYVWTGTIATVAVAQFWRMLSNVYTVSGAKRLFGPIGAGGALGAMSGAAGAEVVQHWLPPSGLLGVGAAIMAASATIPLLLIPRHAPKTAGDGRSEEHDRIAATTRRYLRTLLLLAAVTATTATLVDFAFKSVVDQELSAEQMVPFFSRFYFALNLLSLLVQLVAAPYLLRVIGVGRALLVLPLTLALGAAGLIVLTGLVAAVLLRAADAGLRQSLHRNTFEVLHFPLSAQARKRYKASIEAIGHRTGQALGSVLIVLTTFAGLGLREISFGIIALSAAWAALAWSAKRGYLDLFRYSLRKGTIDPSAEAPPLDLPALELLMTSLNSERDEEVLSTLELLVSYERQRLVPALLLHHPSRAVALRTLEILSESGRTDFVSVARRLLEHEDDEIRAAAMQAVAGALSPEELRRDLQTAAGRTERTAILVALIAKGVDVNRFLAELDESVVRTGEPESQIALVRAVRYQREQTVGHLLLGLADTTDLALRRELARAFGALREPRAVDSLIAWVESRGTREHARAALVAIGEPALVGLSAVLSNTMRPRALRAHLPRAIARFGGARAVDILVDQLRRERDGWVRYKILRALRTLSETLEQRRIPAVKLAGLAEAALVRATDILARRLAFTRAHVEVPARATPGAKLLEAIFREKEEQALDRAVRIVALEHPREVLNGIVHAVRSRDRQVRAESRELLENVSERSFAAALSALLDDEVDDERRVELARAALRQPAALQRDYVSLLRELIDDESEAVRCMAAYHAGELGLSDLEGALRSAMKRSTGTAGYVIERTLQGFSDRRVAHV
jgi:AAA family ATP:ADP antiporter